MSQTYRDIEVVLVDDGSPDNCPVLCDQWAKKDQRIKVVHKPNGGLSDARNAGFDNATGDYVIFVDSDDFWVSNTALQDLMAVISKHPECDFISFNCSYYYSDNNTYEPWVKYDDSLSKPIDKDTAMRSLVASGTMPMSACLKVISRKSFSDMGLRFIRGILSEDIPWFIDLLDGSKKCMFVNQYIYAYRQNRAGSITASGGAISFISSRWNWIKWRSAHFRQRQRKPCIPSLLTSSAYYCHPFPKDRKKSAMSCFRTNGCSNIPQIQRYARLLLSTGSSALRPRNGCSGFIMRGLGSNYLCFASHYCNKHNKRLEYE